MQSSFTQDPANRLNQEGKLNQEYEDLPATVDLRMTTIGLSLTQMVQTTKYQFEKFVENSGLTNRTFTHLILIILAVLAISVSNLELAWNTISVIRPLKQPFLVQELEPAAPVEERQPLPLPARLNNTLSDVLIQFGVPRTIVPERTTPQIPQNSVELRRYIVEPGDTISGIAAKFGLSPETIVWSNSTLENNPDFLSVGQELIVLPVDGIYHQVGGGDTVEAIASTFKTEVAGILNHPLNNLDPENPIIQPGQWLVVPGGSKPFIPRTVTAYSGPVPIDASVGSGSFGWPASGDISNGFYSYHPAIDIAAWLGAPVLAADSGYVVVSGWDNLFGYHIVLDHGNGYQTLYAHLQSYYVDVGANVAKGDQIGEMGSTGNSTGPHLHFEVRQGTIQRNPYGFLP